MGSEVMGNEVKGREVKGWNEKRRRGREGKRRELNYGREA